MSPARVDAGSVAVDEAFAVLVCDDPELLDAEFEAIMTANGFDAEPPAPALPLQGSSGWRDGTRRTPRSHVGRPWASAVTAHMHRRQRSPP
jgi:hypothetical protein